ncbi:MAG: hypothetical protein JSS74_12265 [Actinobacteria bacterium]|nr:hypothetical protein [Actinomycetota bacterium]
MTETQTTNVPRTGVRGSLLTAAVLLASLGLAGCTGTPAPGATASGGTTPVTSSAAGCAEASAIDGIVMAQLSGPPSDAGLLTVADAYQKVADAAETANPAVHHAAMTAADALTQAVKDGTGPAALEDPAYGQAAGELGKFVFDECGYQTLPVTAKDFEFVGLPDSIGAGISVVQLSNKGENPHVVEISLIPDAATTVKDIIADPSAAMASGLVKPVAGGAFTTPGALGYLTAKLEPGRYIVTCMIPDSENKPHAMHGMYHELTVQ